MGIVDEDVATVRQSADIVAIVGTHTQLRKVGQRWSGLCPFHNEKSPSFSVNQAEGLYYCFGCRASGDVITFVREMEHLDFVGAVEWLATKTGTTLRYTERNESESRRRLTRLQEAVEAATEWYHRRLLSADDAGQARGYLRSRGLDKDAVAQFRIGWAPGGWDELTRALDVPGPLLDEAGLTFVNRRGRRQDFFRSRILFPISDDQGRPIAFGGRKLPDAEGPKYQNSREGPLYHKSRTLYALHAAKADVVASGEAVVCEGYTDVIGFFRAGIPRAVATCGTALTEEHVAHLTRFTKRVVLAYDADEAGQAAAERVYEWERRHEIEFAVMELPAGTDPDDLARDDPAALATAVAEATPFLGFRVNRVLAAARLDSPEGRARAADAALAVVAEHPNPLVRDQYVMQIADTCRFDADRLREQLREVVASPRRTEAAGSDERRADRSTLAGSAPDAPATRERARIRTGAEIEALRLLAQQPAEVVGELEPWLFTDGPVRRAYEALAAGGSPGAAMDGADEAASEVLARVAVEEPTAEAEDVLARLTDAEVARVVAAMENEARQSDDPLEFAPALSWLKLRVDDLRSEESDPETRRQLLAWLREHAEELPR